MALGSAGSDRVASENQAVNSRKGSSAAVKSPLVNPFGCCIEADSDISEFKVVAGVPSRVSVLRSSIYRYRGCTAARLWRRLPAATFAFVLALLVGGCRFSYQLDNLFGKKDDGSLTGSLQVPAAPSIKPVADLPPEGDLVIARAAVSEVMSKGGKDTSVSWENPKTGARGTVTPIAAARSEDGLTCHEFLASFEREGSSSWMQGEACRVNKGKWEVRTLKPWQQRT
jgi:outer membrane surface antigen